MSSRQAVIELGSWTAKAGLWEQTFLPTHIIPSFGRRNGDGSLIFGKDAWSSDEGSRAYSIVDGKLADIEVLEALIRHILRDELMASEPWGDVYVLLVIPAAWDVPVQAQLLRLMFERFGVAGLYLGEAPVMAAFGCGTMNCMVVDVGHCGAECSVVWDGQLVRAVSGERFPVGGKDLVKALGSYSSNGWDSLDPESPSAKAALDLFFANEGIQHLLVNTILPLMEQERRPALLEAIVVTGLGSQVPGLGARLLAEIKALLPASEYYGEHQGKKASLKRVPEYYTEVWERATPVAAWFGAGITSKMVFPDPRAYYGREEFAQHGPLLLHSKPL